MRDSRFLQSNQSFEQKRNRCVPSALTRTIRAGAQVEIASSPSFYSGLLAMTTITVIASSAQRNVAISEAGRDFSRLRRLRNDGLCVLPGHSLVHPLSPGLRFSVSPVQCLRRCCSAAILMFDRFRQPDSVDDLRDQRGAHHSTCTARITAFSDFQT